MNEYGDGKTADVGEYTFVRRDSGSIESYRVHGNTKDVLRTICENVNLPYDNNWTTRQMGSKLIDFIEGK
ncbi:MAG: hypothetical protein K2I69_01215 [Muribaculaceae bacterium]|nr:hypothetical protein [Muribaculaceae bacterium]